MVTQEQYDKLWELYRDECHQRDLLDQQLKRAALMAAEIPNYRHADGCTDTCCCGLPIALNAAVDALRQELGGNE